MNQAELNRQVAQATGESVNTIAKRGFGLLYRIPREPDRRPLWTDWDEAQRRRQTSP